MKRHLKLCTSLLAFFFMVFLLSACGTSLEKPTGLEDLEFEQEELADEEQLEETQVLATDGVADTLEGESTEVPDALQTEQEQADPQEQATAVPNDKQQNKTSEAESAGTKQPASKPVVDQKKPSTTTPVPPATPPAEKPVEKEKQPESKSNAITYSIVISSTEIPLEATEMEITDGDTVLKALIAITKEKKIQMDYRGGQGATAYVEGIDNVYEFDRGQGSGWMYRVNGIFPDRGAGVVPLYAGDIVEWMYTTNLGVDIDANLEPFRR
ncbi:DUF4430 domain-containing protein [Sporosarcina sp. FSL K6-1522]|uniref:DUF4430 domain-containing protein n=1 Tax=Sporosarcina sp. FSL K6-1522 TaxID=2921554 RepID=UPI00315A4585